MSNTIFSMNVATLYGATSALIVVTVIPVLGVVSDAQRRRKPWVVWFTVICCAACMAIGVLGQRTLPLMGAEVLDAQPRPVA